MLKWIGCILVMTGCVGGGMVMAVGLKRRIRILEELEVLLQRLYGEMEYAGNDMIDILKILQAGRKYLFFGIMAAYHRTVRAWGFCAVMGSVERRN